MRDFFPDDLLLQQIDIKRVVHFDNYGDHFHVCVWIDDHFYHFMMFNSTDQNSSLRRMVDRGIRNPYSVVKIKNDPGFNLKNATHIDCNKITAYTPDELLVKIRQENWQFKGYIDDSLYKEILTGATLSNQVSKRLIKLFNEKLRNL